MYRRNIGIVRVGRNGYALGYGWWHGALYRWPYAWQKAIVSAWNPINCLIWGHDDFLLGKWAAGANFEPNCGVCTKWIAVGAPQEGVRERRREWNEQMREHVRRQRALGLAEGTK